MRLGRLKRSPERASFASWMHALPMIQPPIIAVRGASGTQSHPSAMAYRRTLETGSQNDYAARNLWQCSLSAAGSKIDCHRGPAPQQGRNSQGKLGTRSLVPR